MAINFVGKLLGPNILITGANRGIGLGLVKELLKLAPSANGEGVRNVIAACRSPEQAEVGVISMRCLLDSGYRSSTSSNSPPLACTGIRHQHFTW